MKTLFQSKSRFKVWKYLISHGQLLLRSLPTDSQPIRIELLFKGVYAIKMTMEISGVTIREPTQDELSAINEDIGTPVTELGLKAFVVESFASWGYVIASVFRTAEDDGDYKTPSSLLIE